MINSELGSRCIKYMAEKGADKSQYTLVIHDKEEINFNETGIVLFRSTNHSEITLRAIKANKMSKVSMTNLEEDFIRERISDLMDMCDASEVDENNDIAPYQNSEEFKDGEDKADVEKIHRVICKFLRDCKEQYPSLKINESYVCFNKVEEHIVNSNGVDFKTSTGEYEINIFYAAKEGDKSSSFNAVVICVNELPEDLLECSNVRNKLEESIEQLSCTGINGKFNGNMIITPECLLDFIRSYNNAFLSDMPLITKTSILVDKLSERVASEKLTISCNANHPDISSKAFVTKDGFKAENVTYIEKGILKSYLLSQYGAKKTGLKLNPTEHIIMVEPGEKSLEEMIKGTDRGIILGRFSGGEPASNGDFSGVAKNSYYIEAGEIKFPLKETMISGNLYDIFNSIDDISKEVLNLGYASLPWIKVNGITISGKE